MAPCPISKNPGLLTETREHKEAMAKIEGWRSTLKFPCSRQRLSALLTEMAAYFSKMQKENPALWQLLSEQRQLLSGTVARRLQAMNTLFGKELLSEIDVLKSGNQRLVA